MVRGCSLQNSRTDGIDAQTARKLDCGCWHEVLQGAVGKGGGRSGSNRFPPDHPSGEGERSAVCDVRDALSHDLHLAERFVQQTGEKVVALQVLERLERNGSHGRDDRVDIANLLEQGSDGIGIQDVDR